MWNRFKQRIIHIVLPGTSLGFSLVELLVAMVTMGIIISAVYAVFLSSNRSYTTQDEVANAQQAARVGIDFIVRDVRMAGLDPLDGATDAIEGGNAGIKEATATKVRFTSDADMDGVIEEANNERMTFEYDAANTRLRRCLYEGTPSETWQTIIEDVSALTFGYLDVDNIATATLADIRTVVIAITTQGTDAQGNTLTRALNTRVRCRNL